MKKIFKNQVRFYVTIEEEGKTMEINWMLVLVIVMAVLVFARPVIDGKMRKDLLN